jgi:hypothetical protein
MRLKFTFIWGGGGRGGCWVLYTQSKQIKNKDGAVPALPVGTALAFSARGVTKAEWGRRMILETLNMGSVLTTYFLLNKDLLAGSII